MSVLLRDNIRTRTLGVSKASPFLSSTTASSDDLVRTVVRNHVITNSSSTRGISKPTTSRSNSTPTWIGQYVSGGSSSSTSWPTETGKPYDVSIGNVSRNSISRGSVSIRHYTSITGRRAARLPATLQQPLHMRSGIYSNSTRGLSSAANLLSTEHPSQNNSLAPDIRSGAAPNNDERGENAQNGDAESGPKQQPDGTGHKLLWQGFYGGSAIFAGVIAWQLYEQSLHLTECECFPFIFQNQLTDTAQISEFSLRTEITGSKGALKTEADKTPTSSDGNEQLSITGGLGAGDGIGSNRTGGKPISNKDGSATNPNVPAVDGSSHQEYHGAYSIAQLTRDQQYLTRNITGIAGKISEWGHVVGRCCQLVGIFVPIVVMWVPWWWWSAPEWRGLPSIDVLEASIRQRDQETFKDGVRVSTGELVVNHFDPGSKDPNVPPDLEDPSKSVTDSQKHEGADFNGTLLRDKDKENVPPPKKEHGDDYTNKVVKMHEAPDMDTQFPAARQRWCELLREGLERAGPVYIKWGQWASTRYDLFPVELCDELNNLTQKSPSHPMEDTISCLEKSFGKDSMKYLRMEALPVASGSIGQVYRAKVLLGEWCKDMRAKNERKLKLGDKEFLLPRVDDDHIVEVAVKIQHPNLNDVMRVDFGILEGLASFVDLLPGEYGSYKLRRMLNQFKHHMEDQLDFDLEAVNLRRFIRNFKDWANISFPHPLVSTREVLVESFEPGRSIFQYIKLKQLKRIEAKMNHLVQKRATLVDKIDDASISASKVLDDTIEQTKKFFRKKSQDLMMESARSAESEAEAEAENVSIWDTWYHYATGETVEGGVQDGFMQIDLKPDDYKTPEMRRKTSEFTQLHGALVERLGRIGLLALLKMMILDNFIHADLHPGNVFVRPMQVPQGFMNWPRRCWMNFQSKVLGLGNDVAEIPSVCFLDAGLSATISPRLAQEVRNFFAAMIVYDGENLAKAILALSADYVEGLWVKSGSGNEVSSSKNLEYTKNARDFIEELDSKSVIWRKIRNDPVLYRNCRSRDVIRDVLDTCRRHNVELNPTILVAAVSTMTLEGWQFELDPNINIMYHVNMILEHEKKWEGIIAKIDQAFRDQALYLPENAMLLR